MCVKFLSFLLLMLQPDYAIQLKLSHNGGGMAFSPIPSRLPKPPFISVNGVPAPHKRPSTKNNPMVYNVDDMKNSAFSRIMRKHGQALGSQGKIRPIQKPSHPQHHPMVQLGQTKTQTNPLYDSFVKDYKKAISESGDRSASFRKQNSGIKIALDPLCKTANVVEAVQRFGEPSESLISYIDHLARGDPRPKCPSKEYIHQLVANDREPSPGYLPKLFFPHNFAANLLALGPSMLGALRNKSEQKQIIKMQKEEELHVRIMRAVESTIEYLDVEKRAEREVDEWFVAMTIQGPLELMGEKSEIKNWTDRAKLVAPPILAAWEREYAMLRPDALDPLNLDPVEQLFVQSFAKTNHIRSTLLRSAEIQNLDEIVEIDLMALRIACGILSVAITPLEFGAHATWNYLLFWNPMIKEEFRHNFATWKSVKGRLVNSYANLREIQAELDLNGIDGSKIMHRCIENVLDAEMTAIKAEFPAETKGVVVHLANGLWWKHLVVEMLNDEKIRPKIGNLETISRYGKSHKEVEFRLTIPMDSNTAELFLHPRPPPVDNNVEEGDAYEFLEFRRRKRNDGPSTTKLFTADQFHSLIFGTEIHSKWLFVYGTFCPRGCKSAGGMATQSRL